MYPLILTLRKAFVVLCATSFVCTSSEETVNHEGRLSSPEDVLQSFRYIYYQRSEYPKDCRDVQLQCSTSSSSGVYLIKPDGYKEPFEVFCNNDVDTGGWTVILRRLDGSVNFTRCWSEYKDGFGFLSTEFWLGNEKFSHLTNQATYELRLDVELSNGASFYVLYNGFRVSDEWNEYKITFAGHFESNAESLITACPPNMVYETCNCQTTCEDPKGESGCHSDCIGSESCVCPEGFLMHGSDCTSASECGCFVPEVNFVVPNGELYINDDCTQKCSCNNNQLTCAVYSCSTNAVCDVKNEIRQCYCNEGYESDGETCVSLTYTDCQDVYDSGRTQDGVYTILPSRWPGLPFNVTCKMDNGGGWTVFQRRNHGSTSFYQNWASYKDGFGNHDEDFWLGNEKLHYLTTQKDYKLRFDVITSRGWPKYAEYAEFEVESENDNYRMSKLGVRSGDTGDFLIERNRGKYFSTYDRDNDACGNFNCAEKHRSGWWHSNTGCSYCGGSACSRFQYSSCHTECTADNLNGDYNGGNGENIMSHSTGDDCYVGFVEMKIRPCL